MVFDSAFNCKFTDCITPVVITAIICLILLIILHIYLYFRFVRIAKKRFGDSPLPD